MHHLIFEGPELAGKSWLMSEIYNALEPKYNKSRVLLDGCHWLNCDLGIFGGLYGKKFIENYLPIFKLLNNENILVEKFHLADIVNRRLYQNKSINYSAVEKKLIKFDFKIILVLLPGEESIIKKRIKDRLALYPHYERILHPPGWYLKQQKEYLREIKKTRLPYLAIRTDVLPDSRLSKKILEWIGE